MRYRVVPPAPLEPFDVAPWARSCQLWLDSNHLTLEQCLVIQIPDKRSDLEKGGILG